MSTAVELMNTAVELMSIAVELMSNAIGQATTAVELNPTGPTGLTGRQNPARG